MTKLPEPKKVTELSDKELVAIYNGDPKVLEDIRSLYIQQIETLKFELDKIEKFFSDFTSRSGVLMTVAGLLSFLPQLIFQNQEYLPNFLTWTFPFLIGSLVFYYLSSFRIHMPRKAMPFAPKESAQALIYMRSEAKFFEEAWTRTHERYDKVLFWSRCTHASIYAYLLSLLGNYYAFVFIGEPSIRYSSVVVAVAGLMFFLMVFGAELLSKKNVKV